MTELPKIDAIIQVKLYNGQIIQAVVLAIVETSSGHKIRIRSGDVVMEISQDQVF